MGRRGIDVDEFANKFAENSRHEPMDRSRGVAAPLHASKMFLR
jgi:hypothetical protein